ncbi:MAG: response regulator [Chloroflexota bacterium]
MTHSVLIVSEELSFLLQCYSGLHRDKRIGQVEATTSREEAAVLIQSLHPDAVVFDSSAGDSFGVAAIERLRALAPNTKVVVTFRPREQESTERSARSHGAMGVLSREAFSAEALVRIMRGQPDPDRQSVAAPA